MPTRSRVRASRVSRRRASSCPPVRDPDPGSRQGHGTARTTHPAAHARWRAENGDEDGDGSDDGLTGRVGALVAVTESAQGATLTRADGLTGEDVRNLNAVLAHALAANTQANYRGQWQRFAAWALTRGVRALPAAPAHVAAYLAERIERAGHRPATLRMATAAIACIHRAAGLADPCAAAEVRRALSGAIRKAGRRQKQAAALTADALAMIEATAAQPRPGRGGRPESRATATNRGRVDLALISLMRDAMLRVSEAAALTWADIGGEPDGTGRLLIRRSKTDPEGEGAVAFLSVSTMARLAAIRAGAAVGGRVFGLCRKQMATRIKQAAHAAGLGEGFSGHSPRVGMARDLARGGRRTAPPDDRRALALADHAGALHPERNRRQGRRGAVLRRPAPPHRCGQGRRAANLLTYSVRNSIKEDARAGGRPRPAGWGVLTRAWRSDYTLRACRA